VQCNVSYLHICFLSLVKCKIAFDFVELLLDTCTHTNVSTAVFELYADDTSAPKTGRPTRKPVP